MVFHSPRDPTPTPWSWHPSAIGGLSREMIAAVVTGAVPLVLVIDDSPTVRTLLATSCRRVGIPVATFPDALQAFKALTQHEIPLPDAVILDVHLPPPLDGYRVARLLRQQASMRHIPILMLSGECGIWAKLRSRWAGADAYLTKPFNPASLVQQLRLILGLANGVS